MHKGDATVTITAMPGKHSAEEAVNELLMPVNGHLLDFSRDGDELYRLYITGDTMLVDSLEESPPLPRHRPRPGPHRWDHLPGHRCHHDRRARSRAVEITKPRTAIPIHYNDFWCPVGLGDSRRPPRPRPRARIRLPRSWRYLHIQTQRVNGADRRVALPGQPLAGTPTARRTYSGGTSNASDLRGRRIRTSSGIEVL